MEALLNYTTLGRLVTGHSNDCNRKTIERQLQDHDKQLYLKWNAKKRNGLGVWEVRRLPNEKEFVFKTEFGSTKIYELEYRELDLVHHVLDVPVLSYELLGRIKRMDAWANKNYLNDMEYTANVEQAKVLKNAKDELTYEVKQNKRVWRDFASFVSQGGNPGQVLNKFRP
jgi:hypothetical protein